VVARLQGEFGTVTVQPNPDDLLVSGQVSPHVLWQQLRKFADLPSIGMRSDVEFQTRVAMTDQQLRLADLTIESPEIRAQSPQLVVDFDSALTSMFRGTIQCQATGASVRTLAAPITDIWWLADSTVVTAHLAGSATEPFQLTAAVKPAALNPRQTATQPFRPVSQPVATATRTAIATPEFKVDEGELRLSLMPATDASWQVREGTLTLPGLQAQLQGLLQPAPAGTVLDLTTTVAYDLETLTLRLLGPQSPIRLTGRGQDTFLVTGSTNSSSAFVPGTTSANELPTGDPLRVSGKIAWQGGSVYGMPLGPGTLQAQYDQGVIRTEPIQVSLGGGQASVMARYDSHADVLELASGSRIEQIQLTREFCQEWLGYVSPMMADATEVQGSVSARLDRFHWNFAIPDSSLASGTLTVHSAEAAPGASLLQMLQLIDTVRRLDNANRSSVVRSLSLPPQNVTVDVHDGAVYHQGLQVELAGYQMESSGSVGLRDQQLQVVLPVPLEKQTAGTGKTNTVPLRGTVRSPQPDLSGVLQSLGTNRLEQQLNDQLDRGLNKLFRSIK
ncbi:MAG: hypothetical protein KDA85_16635, partial [Planctomycetaceae bacterium]|nr:hypothetical protein [Planctomycetaceae bacterium]